ncbi:MAG: hypothetical protein KJ718_02725 [Nanoarchaeota archaeon]|nr:hypothetical protein [Nanoarchaeota archaeon]MBU1051444.1 hypothetical protein [Nanoarchaeota archaeon]MBU1987890.1 hypothetical protein [Nanoarchaeota archaeon]
MQTIFKRHTKVKLLIDPDPEYIEYDPEFDPEKTGKPLAIKKGMNGKVNVILPNGQYHVEVLNKEDKTIAYVMMDEEFLQAVDE